MNGIKADWAIKSKNIGDAQEYRVLACSVGEFDTLDFENIFRTLSVGTMPLPIQTSSDSPAPWITYGTYSKADKEHLVAVVQNWSNKLDFARRPIAELYCLAVPYIELSTYRMGFFDLYEKFISLNLDHTSVVDLGKVELSPEISMSPNNIAAIINEIGFDFCAVVAALLLKGSVAIVGSDIMVPIDRLKYLDAIISLLPYGIRSDLSMSTWVQSSSRHTIRVGFTDSARPEQFRVEWKQTPETPIDTLVSHYYNGILDLSKRHGIVHIVDQLASQTEPYSFQDAQRLLDVLAEIDRPYYIWSSMKYARGDVNSSDIRGLFRSDKARILQQDLQVDLLRFLLADLTDDNVKTLTDYWIPDLWFDLIIAGCAFLDARQVEEIRPLVTIAASLEKAAELLKDLFSHASKTYTLKEKQKFIGLVLEWIKADEKLAVQFDKQHLFIDLVFLYEFILRTPSSELQPLFNELNHLLPQDYGGFQLFQIASNNLEQDVRLPMIEALARTDPIYVLGLLGFADVFGRITQILPVTLIWLSKNIRQFSLEDKKRWHGFLSQRIINYVISLSLSEQATLDIAYLSLDDYYRPVSLPIQVSAPSDQFEIYLDEFCQTIASRKTSQGNISVNLLRWFNEQIECMGNSEASLQNLQILLSEAFNLIYLNPVDSKKIPIMQLRLKLEQYLRHPAQLSNIVVVFIDALLLDYQSYNLLIKQFVQNNYFDDSNKFYEFSIALQDKLESYQQKGRYNVSRSLYQKILREFLEKALTGQLSSIKIANDFRVTLSSQFVSQVNKLAVFSPIVANFLNQSQKDDLAQKLDDAKHNIQPAKRLFHL